VQFSLIIPSYNNADELMRELPPFLQFLNGLGYEVETIVVNDGSTRSHELTAFCEARKFTLLHHAGNLGKGAAVRTGMLAAGSSIRIFTDADIPFQYDTIVDILRFFHDNPEVDVVAGDRRKSDYFAKTPPLRRLGSRIFSGMVDVIMMKSMGDTQCGIKGFRSRCVNVVFMGASQNGFAADIEWLHRASQHRLKMETVSAEFRNAGQSSVVLWKHALLMLRDVLKIRFS
jgi:glycosyltransferase involved in cell wall biosynthesis